MDLRHLAFPIILKRVKDMAVELVSAQTTESQPVEFEYDFGDNLENACSMFGEDVVFAYAKRGLVVAAQGHARGHIRAGKSKEEIVTAMQEWKPGMPRQPKSQEERIRDMLNGLSPEARTQLAKELKAGGKAAA